MMRSFLIASFLILGTALTSTAQIAQQSLTFTYNPAFPVGDLQDFTNEVSWRGFAADYRYPVLDQLDVGFYIGWNGFYEKRENETYDFQNSSLYATTWRYLYNVPVYGQVHYTMGTETFQGYVGIGAGLNYVDQEWQIADVSIYDSFWKFGFAPDLGLRYNLPSSNVGFQMGARYNFIAYNELQLGNLSYFNVNAGVVFNFY